MSAAGRVALRDAIKHTAKHHADKRAAVKRATVTSIAPLTVSMFGFAHPLTEANDFDLSAWMTLYQAVVGLQVDDHVLLSHEDSLVLFDVVSDRDPVAAFNAWK